MKALLLMLALVSATAHASGNHDLWFNPVNSGKEVRLNWITHDDVTQACNIMIVVRSPRTRYDPNIKACATRYVSGDVVVCDIYTGKSTSLAIVGHEVRHCFEGAWHP